MDININKCTIEECEKLYTSQDKWKISILAGILFILISNKYIYLFLDKIFNGIIIGPDGFYTLFGLMITTIIYILITRILMK
jgi:hypothetical protein